MEEKKITMKKTTIQAYTWKCRECGLVINGSRPNEVSFNAGLHVEYHARKKIKGEAKK